MPDASPENSLQDYVHANIPAARTFAVILEEEAGSVRVRVSGRLADHHNHKGTGFGGSLTTAMFIAAFGALREGMRALAEDEPSIVLKECSTRFLRPVTADFHATARQPDADTLRGLAGSLAEKGRARIVLNAAVPGPDGAPFADFEGEFVLHAAVPRDQTLRPNPSDS